MLKEAGWYLTGEMVYPGPCDTQHTPEHSLHTCQGLTQAGDEQIEASHEIWASTQLEEKKFEYNSFKCNDVLQFGVKRF